MITKTIGLGAEYTDLFAEIKEASNGEIVVNSLEEFFMYIQGISKLEGGKFLRLPLDEPIFEIDANTRKIAIPADFSSNGLSVQGDHLAETIFFRIDRYFDYVDLNNMDILINWKMGSESGQSKNFIKSVDIDAGHIIFGWPVAKEMTGKSGALSFAVQFCKRNTQGELTYNFNTLVSTIVIKEGLVLEAPEVVDVTNDILNMLTDSVYGKGEAAVADAEWVSGGGKGLVPNGPNAEFKAEVNLPTTIVAGAPADSAVTLCGVAIAGGDEVIYSGDVEVPQEMKFIAVGADEAQVDGMRYYVDDGAKLASAAQIEAWFGKAADAVALFKEYIQLTVSSNGRYCVRAHGVKFDNKGKKIGVGEGKDSEVVVVPSAKAPIAELSIKSQATIGEGYEIDDSGDVIYLDAESGAVLSAGFGLAEGMVEDDKGAWKFIWSKKIGNGSFQEIDSPAPVYGTEASDDLAVTEEGLYKVKINHYKNNSNIDSADSKEVAASYLASPVINAQLMSGSKVIAGEDASVAFNSGATSLSKRNVKVKASAEVDGAYGSTDKLEYVWEKTAVLEPEDGSEVIWEAVESKAEITISAEGYYRCRVLNKYNGSACGVILGPFYAIDTV